MCTANVDMAMKELWEYGKVTKQDTFDDETYFIPNQYMRGLADACAEEICLATRFLSLFSNKFHSQSNQYLKNNLVKGDDNYPRTILAVLKFIQHRSLRESAYKAPKHPKDKDFGVLFVHEGEEEDPTPMPKLVSKTCRQFESGTCAYKVKNSWKKYPSN